MKNKKFLKKICLSAMLKTTSKTNCYRLKYSVKSVCIWSFSGPFFPAFGLNTDHKISEYRHFSRTESSYFT